MECQGRLIHFSFLPESWFLQNRLTWWLCVYWILLILALLDMFLSKDKQLCIDLLFKFFFQYIYVSCFSVFLLHTVNVKYQKCFPAISSYGNGKSPCCRWEAYKKWLPIFVLYDLFRVLTNLDLSAKLILYLVYMHVK